MSTVLAFIGLLVVAKIAFVFLFPVTAARIQARAIVRGIERTVQAVVTEQEARAQKDR